MSRKEQTHCEAGLPFHKFFTQAYNQPMNQKIIGVIGGVGPQATSYLYSKVIQLSQSKYCAKNNDEFPHLIVESLPIPDFI